MMRIIIDGYNLMAKMGGMDGALEARRERMIRIFSRFQSERGHAVTVVFDGERGDGASESWQRIQGIEVIFSRMGEKADHV
ncbi:MAG: NYN domain-containing protein, partial [Nitrospirae bacterium]|nr:NYN domain-containing protein [Nitrospirota bacterium]